MKIRKGLSTIIFLFAIVAMFFTIGQFCSARKSSASVFKNTDNTTSSKKSLSPIKYNGEEMYVAKATFYDYYSDSQVCTTSTPLEIKDALDYSKNTFSLFNNKLFQLMKYGDAANNPAKYPMYQGRAGIFSDMATICKPGNETFNTSTNYWVAANSPQGVASATQGLVDSTLTYTADGESHLTQSNPANGKSANVPFFDKDFLTKNKFDNSQLSLGSVKENVSFPFRRVTKDDVTYYEFYSNNDTVRFNSKGQLDYVGYNTKDQQVLDPHGNASFFPYNSSSESNSAKLNYGHGLKIEIPFIMNKDGKLNGKDMIFEFSGDDDVWVFIDGQLALDIGGSHGEIKGNINFANQISTVSLVKNNEVAFSQHTLGSFNSGKVTINGKELIGRTKDMTTPFSDALKNAIKDTAKEHTLTFFYMERGMDIANLKLNFNLPEPSKLNVANTISTEGVSDTFKEETLKVANKDEFVYDIADKTELKAASVNLKNTESVTFINEFNANDTMLIQERALKDTNRKLTELYSTAWNLKDFEKEISNAKGLIVSDNRCNSKSYFLLANTKANTTPVLTATYTNTPNVGIFTLLCKVDDNYKKINTNYANKEFKYEVKYSKVFGGDSAETLYNGKYTVYHTDKTSEERIATNGIITLKPDEKAVIAGISVRTVLNVKATIENEYKLGQIRTTTQFKYDNATASATGAVNVNANIVEFTVTNSASKEQVVIEEIKTNNNNKTEDPSKELEKVEIKDNANTSELDNSPKTGDYTNVSTWMICAIVAFIVAMSSLIIGSSKRKY